MPISNKLFCITTTLCLWGINLFSHADILSPEAYELRARAHKYPNLIDRSDQYCTHKKISDLCKIPGDHFSGGGNGKCERDLNESAGTLDLNCIVNETLAIDRRLPDGPFHSDKDICDSREIDNVVCAMPRLISDQFCTDKAENDPCEIKGRLFIPDKESTIQAYQGKCTITTETKRQYFRGYHKLTRPTLLCSSVQPVPAKIYQKESLPQRLWLNIKQ